MTVCDCSLWDNGVGLIVCVCCACYMMCRQVCKPNFEILPSFFHFHFHFAVFVDDHGACSVKHVAAAEKWLGVFSESSVCVHGVWRVRRVHVKLRTIRSIFYLPLCVCVFMQEMVSVTTKDLVHAKVEVLTMGLCAPGQPVMHWTTFLLWLYQHCSTHSSTFECFFRRDPRYNRIASSRMIISWLFCFYCIRHD